MLEGERAQALETSARNKSQKPDGKKHVEVKKMTQHKRIPKTPISREEFMRTEKLLKKRWKESFEKAQKALNQDKSAQKAFTREQIEKYLIACEELAEFEYTHVII